MSEKNQLTLKSRIATASDCIFVTAVKRTYSGMKLRCLESFFMRFIVVVVAVFAASAPAQAKHVYWNGVDFHTRGPKGPGQIQFTGSNSEIRQKCRSTYELKGFYIQLSDQDKELNLDLCVESHINPVLDFDVLDFDAEMEG